MLLQMRREASRRFAVRFYGRPTEYDPIVKTNRAKRTEGETMRGFYTNGGYCGRVNGKYILFASESDYFDFMSDED